VSAEQGRAERLEQGPLWIHAVRLVFDNVGQYMNSGSERLPVCFLYGKRIRREGGGDVSTIFHREKETACPVRVQAFFLGAARSSPSLSDSGKGKPRPAGRR